MVDIHPPYRDRWILYRLYYCEGLTQAQIAEELECCTRTVIHWMDHHGLSPGVDGPKRSLSRMLAMMDPDAVGEPWPDGNDRWKRIQERQVSSSAPE